MDDHFYDEEDLVTANPNDRNWKGIIIAVIVISSVLALIVTSVVLLTPPDEDPRVKGRRFELDDIFGPHFQPGRLNGSWISDTEWLFRDTSGGASVLDVTTFAVRSLISNHTFRQLDSSWYSLSADLKYVLFAHNVQKVHRYSFTARYTMFELSTGARKGLHIEGNPDEEGLQKYSTLQLARWSPKGSGLIVVYDGDIYYWTDPLNLTKRAIRITTSAVPGIISNGIPDWLYEEEILESSSALWFSPDGQKILFLTFNDSLVKEHPLLQYGSVEEPHLYPRVKTLRYPKPGTMNPTVVANILDLENIKQGKQSIKNPKPPEPMRNMDHYITGGGWASKSEVAIVWSSRSYNLSIISLCASQSASCKEVYRMASERRGWIESTGFPVFSVLGRFGPRTFITIAPIRDGENGFFDHLVLVDTENERSHPITHGSFDVFKIVTWDEEEKLIYFIGIPHKEPGERQLYQLKVEQPFTDHSPLCLTCQMEFFKNGTYRIANSTLLKFSGTSKVEVKKVPKRRKTTPAPEPAPTSTPPSVEAEDPEDAIVEYKNLMGSNKSCSFVTNVKFSQSRNYLVIECSGLDIPHVVLVSATPSTNLTVLKILQNNDGLLNLTRGMAFPQVRTFPVRLLAGYDVYVRLLLPPGLREDEITKYPLILNVYGGPGTQLAMDRWAIDFTTYLASKKDYIVAQIDSRGSGGRGWNFQHQVYYQIGKFEIQDQIEVVKYLKGALHFVEPRKIGIWGWSYGGYLTARIMTNKESNEIFQCGAAIAPVTNWKLYDSAYTERYMGTPNVTDNFKGYAESDVTRNLQDLTDFENKMFYLIHGTADDNVHLQHTMLLAKALIAKKILFRQQIYPDEPHSLAGVKIHLHRSLENFFEDCFKKQAPPELGTGLNKGGKFDGFD